MKKIFLFLCLLVSCSVWADAKETLQQRLNKVEGFYAQFHQIVKTPDNQLIQEGNGELWVNRPNLFNWQINEPDETAIISDGKNLWIYMPMVEQVTIMSLDQAVDNRLLLLITNSDNTVWQDYQVERKQNSFTLTPTDGSQQEYIITVLPTGMISNFTIIEEDGQQSIYELSHQKLGTLNNQKMDSQKFVFTVPDGIVVDDQR